MSFEYPELLLQLLLHLEYPGVEHYHHQAGDVEGAQAGPDDEVRVVEGADDGVVLVWWLRHVGVRPVVEPEHDGQPDGAGGGPAGRDGEVGGQRVVSVLAVQDGRRHREEPVQADGHQVEDWGGGADDVTGQIKITDDVGQVPPTPVCLRQKFRSSGKSQLVVLLSKLL